MEPKWYVYLNDHAEGPLTVEQVRKGLQSNKIKTGHFAWRRGMPDWQPIEKIAELEQASYGIPRSYPDDVTPPPEGTLTALMTKKVDPDENDFDQPGDKNRHRGEIEAARLAHQINHEAAKRARIPSRNDLSSTMSVGIRGLMIAGLVAVLFVGAFLGFTKDLQDSVLRSWVNSAAHLIPATTQLIAPIPRLSDWSQDQYAKLLSAALGGGLEVVVTGTDRAVPKIWVAGHRPDGTIVRLNATGVKPTLVGRLDAGFKIEAPFKNRLALLSPAHAAGELGVTPGDYEIEIEGGPKVLQFLGGNRDSAYESALEKFHALLKSQAQATLQALQAELNSIKPVLELIKIHPRSPVAPAMLQQIPSVLTLIRAEQAVDPLIHGANGNHLYDHIIDDVKSIASKTLNEVEHDSTNNEALAEIEHTIAVLSLRIQSDLDKLGATQSGLPPGD